MEPEHKQVYKCWRASVLMEHKCVPHPMCTASAQRRCPGRGVSVHSCEVVVAPLPTMVYGDAARVLTTEELRGHRARVRTPLAARRAANTAAHRLSSKAASEAKQRLATPVRCVLRRRPLVTTLRASYSRPNAHVAATSMCSSSQRTCSVPCGPSS